MVPGPERFVAKLLYLQTILYQALCTRHLRKASEIRHGDAENGLPFGHWPFLFESDRTTKDGRPLARIKPIGIELPQHFKLVFTGRLCRYDVFVDQQWKARVLLHLL